MYPCHEIRFRAELDTKLNPELAKEELTIVNEGHGIFQNNSANFDYRKSTKKSRICLPYLAL